MNSWKRKIPLFAVANHALYMVKFLDTMSLFWYFPGFSSTKAFFPTLVGPGYSSTFGTLKNLYKFWVILPNCIAPTKMVQEYTIGPKLSSAWQEGCLINNCFVSISQARGQKTSWKFSATFCIILQWKQKPFHSLSQPVPEMIQSYFQHQQTKRNTTNNAIFQSVQDNKL